MVFIAEIHVRRVTYSASAARAHVVALNGVERTPNAVLVLPPA